MMIIHTRIKSVVASPSENLPPHNPVASFGSNNPTTVWNPIFENCKKDAMLIRMNVKVWMG